MKQTKAIALAFGGYIVGVLIVVGVATLGAFIAVGEWGLIWGSVLSVTMLAIVLAALMAVGNALARRLIG